MEDFLTRHSGILPEHLDPAVSRHHLVPLKAAYLKLRSLVDRGCKLLGHGLRADFKTINIFVPPAQVRAKEEEMERAACLLRAPGAEHRR